MEKNCANYRVEIEILGYNGSFNKSNLRDAGGGRQEGRGMGVHIPPFVETFVCKTSLVKR